MNFYLFSKKSFENNMGGQGASCPLKKENIFPQKKTFFPQKNKIK